MAPPIQTRSSLLVSGFAVATIAATALVLVTVAPWAPDRAQDDATDGRLRWPPPDGWQEFTPVEVDGSGGRIRLDDDRDYLLIAPTVVTGPVEIVGGRDVVWIGGHIRINEPGLVGAGQRRGLLVRDDGNETDGRTVHLEGLLFDGGELSEGIDIDAHSAIVQIENVRVEQVGFRGADDRDGTEAYEELGDNHPDVIQTYGGFRELRIDSLTAGTAYQGLFLKVDAEDGTGGSIHMRRVDITATSRTGLDGIDYAGNRLFFWDVDTVGDVMVESGTVWLQHHPDAGKVLDSPNPRVGSGSWWRGAYRSDGELIREPPPGTAGFIDAVERRQSVTGEDSVPPSTSEDELGPYLTWPVGPAGEADAQLLDMSGREPGRIYGGVPPEGSFVTTDSVGLRYRSPNLEES